MTIIFIIHIHLGREDEDVKGSTNTQNFIAHDYEGVNLPIIEFIIRDRLPVLKHKIIIILQ